MKLFLTVLFIITTASFSFADSVQLAWTPNTEPDLVGYEAFVRESGQGYDYANPAWTGPENTCQINNIDANKKYHFVVRAKDSEDYRSENSNEVSYFMGTVPDGIPPEKTKALIITIIVTAQ